MVRNYDISGVSLCHPNNCDVGKQWHTRKSAFRPTSGQTSYEKRTAGRAAMTAMKAKEKEMKDEKEDERQVGQCPRSVQEDHAERKLSETYTSDQR